MYHVQNIYVSEWSYLRGLYVSALNRSSDLKLIILIILIPIKKTKNISGKKYGVWSFYQILEMYLSASFSLNLTYFVIYEPP